MTELATVDTPRKKEAATTSDVLLQLVTFSLLEEEFGLPILDVREIIRMTEITPVPNAPSFVEGVINLRGQIIPVVDLRKRFNLNATEIDDDSRIVVVEIVGNILGLIVDKVSEVLRIPVDSISPPPGIVANGIGSEYIRGITNHLEKMLILIDLKKVFDLQELETLCEI
jgi:purine-binding chemotaxis protein CheW